MAGLDADDLLSKWLPEIVAIVALTTIGIGYYDYKMHSESIGLTIVFFGVAATLLAGHARYMVGYQTARG